MVSHEPRSNASGGGEEISRAGSVSDRPVPSWGLPGAALLFTSCAFIRYFVRTDMWVPRAMTDPANLASYIAFGVAMMQLLTRWLKIRWERRAFRLDLLADDEEALILPEDALDFRKRLRQLPAADSSFILVRLALGRPPARRAHWSAQDAGEAVRSQAEILQSEGDSRYALVRYLAWAIPSIGFIGTVLGIGQAMGSLNTDPSDQSAAINASVRHLHTAFGATFVALILSLVLMFFVHRIQADDDSLLARATDWCLRRFVFRMHIERGSEG